MEHITERDLIMVYAIFADMDITGEQAASIVQGLNQFKTIQLEKRMK